MFSKLFSVFSKKGDKTLKMIPNHFLYYYATCPFCFRVQIAMKQLGIEMEMRNIHQGHQYRDELMQGGGRTMVPCLRIDKDGETQWMYESADIVDYLKGKFSP